VQANATGLSNAFSSVTVTIELADCPGERVAGVGFEAESEKSVPVLRKMLIENLERREEFGLADLLGISKAGDIIGTNGNAYYGRIERSHPILEGFSNTNWLPGAQNRVPLRSVPDPILTVVPGFVQYPPELAYPPASHTEEPAVVLREVGCSRLAYFPGDIERIFWLTGHGDLLRLLHNTIRWITQDEAVVRVDGDGFIELFAWETTPGLRHPPAQLHEPERPPWLVEHGLPPGSTNRHSDIAQRSEGQRRGPASRRLDNSLPARRLSAAFHHTSCGRL
jgi:hypothetical protein